MMVPNECQNYVDWVRSTTVQAGVVFNNEREVLESAYIAQQDTRQL